MKPFATIEIKDAFGTGSFTMTGRVQDRIFDGFNTEGGGWSNADLSHVGIKCLPAEFLIFREKRKRHDIKIDMRRILSDV